MTEQRTCETCGRTLPDGVENCPHCLLHMGLEPPPRDGAKAESQAGSQPAAQAAGKEPSPEELSALFPNLEVLERIGKGGMGVVYKARQSKLDRFVALKILRPESADEPGFPERFLREARTLARLSHPNIVAIHDFGETEGTYWLLMEFVDGLDLRQLMKSGELTPQRALGLVSQICDALQFAHDAGIVHRDIKPENVLLDRRGKVKIADFGLAKLLAKGPADATLTHTDQVLGTLHYMAPEQMQGQDVDHRADIYALGVVLYEMLTGDLPVGHFPPPSQRVAVDVKLDAVVLRALEREPELRYQQVVDVKTDIARASGLGESPEAHAQVGSAPVSAAGAPVASAGEAKARIPVSTFFIGLSFFFGTWVATKLAMSFDGLYGLVLGWVLLVGAGAVTLRMQLKPYPSLREALRSAGKGGLALRVLAALLLFTGGYLFTYGGILADWDRSTYQYKSSRTSMQLEANLYRATVGVLLPELEPEAEIGDLDVAWNLGKFSLMPRPARIGMLIVGACLLSIAILPLVATTRFGSQWRLCWQHVVRIPLLLLLGLGLTLGMQWLRNLDEPPLSREPLVLQWKLDAGLEAVYGELEAFLAEEEYDVHAHLVGTVRESPDGADVALYGLLGAEAASPFARWRMLHDGPHRDTPHLLVEIVGDLERHACVVRVDAGAVREGSFSMRAHWMLWLRSLEHRLRRLES